MTTNIWIEDNKIKIKTDDPATRYLLEVTKEETGYIPWKKSWGVQRTVYKVHENKRVAPDKHGFFNFTIGLGWTSYIASVFKSKITMDEYKNLALSMYSSNHRDIPFPELRDYQNEDVLHILKYRRAVCSLYTSYGKTQVISALTNYAHTLGKRVLLVAPGNKPMDELVKRCKTAFNLDVPTKDLSINTVITSGILNSKKATDPVKSAEFTNLLKTYDWVLVDEVEYCMNPGGFYIFDRCLGAECMYSFSGTAEKQSAQMISFAKGLDNDVVLNNMDLIRYFGPSLVYRVPLEIKIDNISVETESLNNIKFDEKEDFGENVNIYQSIMNKIWTDDSVCQVIKLLIKKYKNLFIPINNLVNILNVWIEKYFIGTFNVLLVCGEGYVYYDLTGTRSLLTLQESCDKIKNGETDVILSTSSGYRALDFPGLENILLIQGNIAGVILQCIGRVARGEHMNILSLLPANGKRIPVYSKGQDMRDELIREYYKYCDQNYKTIKEEDLWK